MSTNTSPLTPPLLVRFYDPSTHAPDSLHRTLPEILSWSDHNLEAIHDYIQTLFPLPEYSPINPHAPIIDSTTFTAFRSSPELRDSLRQAFRRMLRFYGLEIQLIPEFLDSDSKRFTILPSVRFTSRAHNWVTAFNHNHLRITRIIRSLRVLGCQAEAEAFFRGLNTLARQSGRFGNRSLKFWARAARRPLNVAPEDESDDGQGQTWLQGLNDIVGDELEWMWIGGDHDARAILMEEAG